MNLFYFIAFILSTIIFFSFYNPDKKKLYEDNSNVILMSQADLDIVNYLNTHTLEQITKEDTTLLNKSDNHEMSQFLQRLSRDEVKYLSDTLNSFKVHSGSYAYHDNMIYVWCPEDNAFEPITQSMSGCVPCRLKANIKRFTKIINDYRLINKKS